VLGLVKAIGFYSDRFSAAGLSALTSSNQSEIYRQRLATELSSAMNIGIDGKRFASTLVAGDPPPLPSPHLSRLSVFSAIARLFDNSQVAAIADYAESGKSTTVAEFVGHFEGNSFWFKAFEEDASDDSWLAMFSLSLSAKLGAPSHRLENLVECIVNNETKLLVVLDDAHRIQSLSSIEPLLTAIRANPNTSVLMVGIDKPGFVSALRSKGIETCRIPGLTQEECKDLFDIPDEDHSVQLAALNSLRIRCGGHIGLLRLGWQDIRMLQSEQDYIEYLARLPEGGGIGLESMQAALIDQLRSGLSDDEVILCRRVSLAIWSFRKQIGQAVWTIDREFSKFASVWGNCVRKVFEDAGSGRFTMPEVYEAGFRMELSDQEKSELHEAIADGYQDHGKRSVDVYEVHAAVLHRFLSGDWHRAMHDASMYVICASGPGEKQIQQILLTRFDVLFSSTVFDAQTDDAIYWLATCTKTHSDLGNDDKASIAAKKLYACLRSEEPFTGSSESEQRGWFTLLFHYVRYPDAELAIEAASKVDRLHLPKLPSAPDGWEWFMVLSSILGDSKPMLPNLTRIIDTPATQYFEQWFESTLIHGSELWRVISTRIYAEFPDRLKELESRTAVLNDIEKLTDTLLGRGCHNAAAILECVMVRIEIDYFRDFEAADSRSSRLVQERLMTGSAEVRQHVLQTRADSLRCSDRDEEAVKVYREVLAIVTNSMLNEVPDIHLLISISQAKQGLWNEATKTAEVSADLFAEAKKLFGKEQDLAVAKSLLEAAGFAIHGEMYSRAARLLVAVHDKLDANFRNSPFWAAMAQIAWSLVNRISPESADPQPPIPGFTLNLSDTEESQKMQRSGTPLMLGRVCTAVGRPHRAIRYFDKAITLSRDDENRCSVAFFGIEAALLAKDLPNACRYATLTSKWMWKRSNLESEKNHAYVYDMLFGRVFRLAVEFIGKDEFNKLLDAGIALIQSVPDLGPPEQFFCSCLLSMKLSIDTHDLTPLNEPFETCEQRKAGWLAKEFAWIACYRSESSSTTELEFLLWHWRLMRWSIVNGQSDHQFLSEVFGQEKFFWQRIAIENRSQRIQKVITAMETYNADIDGLVHVAKEAATSCAEVLSEQELIRQIQYQLRLPFGDSIADGAIRTLSLRLLDQCLSPFASRQATKLVEKLKEVITILKADFSPVLSIHIQEFSDLLALAMVLNGESPNSDAHSAVRRVCDVAEELTTDSAAQGFVYLRHFSQSAPPDFGFEQVIDELVKPRIRALITAPDISDFMRLRLTAANLASVSLRVHSKLSRSLAKIRSQADMKTPIASNAYHDARAERDDSLDSLKKIIDDLELVAAEAHVLKFPVEEWSALFELGGILQTMGVTLTRFAEDHSAKEKYLVRAMKVFRRAVEAIDGIDREQDAEMITKAAFCGRSLAQILEDEPMSDFFVESMHKIASHGGYADVVVRQEEAEKHSILNMLKPDDQSASKAIDELAEEDFEGYVQQLVDHTMASTGWPADRRVFVEDDVRKMFYFEKEKAVYCKHLVPLQDLRHTFHPSTAYAEATNYVIGCSLLKVQTQIGVTDMRTALNAMKATYCESCKLRTPGAGPAS